MLHSDMCVSLWDMGAPTVLQQRATHHTEFVMGVDFSLTAPPLLVSCSWDGAVCAWGPGAGAPPPIPRALKAPPVAPHAGVAEGGGSGGDAR